MLDEDVLARTRLRQAISFKGVAPLEGTVDE